MTPDPTPTTLTLYRPGRTLFVFLTLLLAILVLFFAPDDPAYLIPYLFLAAFYLVWAADAFYRRLTVNPDGLDYRRLLSTTTARWTDIKAIVTSGMLIRQESLQIQPSWPPGAPAVIIPLTLFSRSWRTGALGQLLKEKAPQLFQASDGSLSASQAA
jgi:hypothetical protein